jgi:hypothetical protein
MEMPNLDGKKLEEAIFSQECYECKKPLYKKCQVLGAFGTTPLLVCGDCDFDYRWRDALKAVGNPLSLKSFYKFFHVSFSTISLLLII